MNYIELLYITVLRPAVSQTHWSILHRMATTLPGDPAAAAQANKIYHSGFFASDAKRDSQSEDVEICRINESLKPEGFQLQIPVGSRSRKV